MESRRCLIIFSMTATTSASESSFLSSTSRCLIAASNRRMADSRCGSLAFMAAFMSSLIFAFSDIALGFLRGGDPQNETARRAALSTPSRRVGPAAGSSGSIEFRRQRLAAQALVVPFDGGGELSLAVGSRLFVELAGAQFGEKPGLFHGPLEAAQRHLEGLVFLDAYGRHAVLIPGQCCSKGANSRLFLTATPAACVPYPPSLPVSPRIRNSCPTVAARRSTSVSRASRRERAASINSRRDPRPSR